MRMKPRIEPSQRSSPPLYESTEIYDVAFGWDLTMELDFVESCLRKHSVEPVRRVLEPACGTGRILAALCARGYEVTGYDMSPAMVAFASAKLARFGGQVMRGEMAAFRPPGRYDAAINLVNSIGYLLEDEALRSHLERVGEVIPPGGVYLVQLSYGGEPPEQGAFGPWPNARAGLKTSLTWRIARSRRRAGPTRSAASSWSGGRSGGSSRSLTCSATGPRRISTGCSRVGRSSSRRCTTTGSRRSRWSHRVPEPMGICTTCCCGGNSDLNIVQGRARSGFLQWSTDETTRPGTSATLGSACSTAI